MSSISPNLTLNTPFVQLGTGPSQGVPDIVYSAAAIGLLLGAWVLGSALSLFDPDYFPTPVTLATALWDIIQHGYQGRSVFEHIGISLFRTLSGFVAGAVIGIPVGLLAGYNRRAGAMISPIMAFIRPIPPIAFIPMAVLYFGLGEVGKIVLIFFVSFNYVEANAQAGAANFPIDYRRASESLGLTKLQTFYRIVMPGALPQIFTGLKVALALSWAVVVAAELVGAQSGLGFMISDAATLFRIPVVFIGVGLIGVIGLMLNFGLNFIEAKVVHWKGR